MRMSHPKELLDQIEELNNLTSFENEIFDFMLRCLDRFKNKLPNSMRQELELAKKFRLGEASEAELKLSRHRVWKFIDENNNQLGSKKVSLLRALIFTLYPVVEPDNDAFEWAHWFIDFSNECTPMEKFQYQLISEIFSEQLNAHNKV